MKIGVLARRLGVYWLTLLLIVSSLGSLAQAQVTTTSRILGTVMDPHGAMVPNAEVVITNDLLHHNCDYTPYEGMKVRGWPVMVMSRGEVVVEEGKLQAEPGRGEFLRCAPPARL